MEQLTWAQLGRHHKPIVLLNAEGFWAPFLSLLQHMHREKFIRPDMDVSFITVDRAEEVLPAIQAALQRAPDSKVDAELAEKF